MAAKVLLLLALVAVVAYADDNCKCEAQTEADEEITRIWEFFKNISTQQEDPKNQLLNVILPGELSPLVNCRCEKSERRRKRMILSEVSEESEDIDYDNESIGGLRQTSKCPHGYVWFGILCVDERLVMDRK